MDAKWEWLCGVNSSYITESQDRWYEDIRNNTCKVDGLVTIPHAAFLLLSSVVLLVLGCCTSYRRIHTKYLLIYPGHSLRWLISVLLLVVILASIGEGIMTDETYRAWSQPTQPHLYIHSIVAFVAVVMSLVYYQHMELWQVPTMSILLLVYWVFTLCNEVLRILSLEYQGHIDVNVVIFDLTIIKLAIYLVLILVELNVIRTKLLGLYYKEAEFPEDLKRPDMLYMHYYVNLFSSLMYWWLNWVLVLGYKKSLELSDLGTLPDQHEAEHNHQEFKKVFLQELEKAKQKGKKPFLGKIYAKVYGRRMMAAAVLKLIGEVFGFVNPVAVGALTAYTITLKSPPESEPDPAHYVYAEEFFKNGFVLVFVMLLSSMVNFFCLQTHYYFCIMEGVKVRAAIQAMVYEKSLRLSTVATTGGKMNIGQITNHMSVDPNAIQIMFQNFNNLWCIPIQLIINLVLLYLEMGYAALIGASVFLVLSPVQFKIATMISKRQKQMLGCSDERLKKTNELLQGIKLLKLYAWEGLYGKAIEAIRRRELGYLLKINVLFITTILLTSASPVLVNVVGFGTYNALTGKPLTPEVTFAALSLFNMLTMPLLILPMSLLYLVNGLVSGKRVLGFLLAPEIENNNGQALERPQGAAAHHGGIDDVTVGFKKLSDQVTITSSASELEDEQFHSSSERTSLLNGKVTKKRKSARNAKYGAAGPKEKHTVDGPGGRLKHGVAIKISHGTYKWDEDSETKTLSDINVEIPEGKLTIVIGAVGSGKSSLLAAMLGEMTTSSGFVQVKDGTQIALAAQKPWLLNASLQNNILFSDELEVKRYKRVIDACSLKPDIDILPAGDQTEIGEKGINLSGGQKQRVSVARAMYSNRNIVILDDPLSALDVHVGRHLFQNGIIKLLVHRKQTVILVTHQLQYLNRADLIVEMKDGRIAAQGTLDDIITADPDMYSEYNQAVRAATESEAEGELSGYESEATREERLRLQRQVKSKTLQSKQLPKVGETPEPGALIEREEMERGSVSYVVYLYYARNVGWLLVALLAFWALVDAGLGIGTNFWLSAWSEAGLGNETDGLTDEYFPVFVGFSVSTLTARVFSMISLVAAMLTAARRLHEKVLRNIIKVPLRFFDMTPIGRVLNRFSNDMQLIDIRFTQTINMLVNTVLRVTSAVVVNAIVMPIFLAFFVPVAIGFYILQRFFLASSRELQRLDSISKSPVFAYFSESLGGLMTIRAYKAGERFYNTVIERINTNLAAFLYLQVATRWLGLRLDFVAATLVFLAGMITLVGAITIDLDPSLVGLAVSYSLQVATFLNMVVRAIAELEIQMNAVERIKHYTFEENEPYDGTEPPAYWPQRGHIELLHVSARYAKNTDPVLNDVSVKFRAGEKVGVCGRTGAGKSSLTLALLRVIDIFDGTILIDGVDIMTVPLTTLRSKISIIPQDPVLFTGTIRKNLDPIAHITNDEELWSALEIAQLKDVVTALDSGLDSEVTEGGENFSVGQRQLFCLARAFLRKSRILIMDEATASIDLETDKILQNVVATAFADRTVLTIAHRITTILNSDNILVLDEGGIAEYGAPSALIEKGGLFASFVRDKDN
ncbi:ATP-binding cassette sub-family C member 9-like [Acanthaster planci]|uniref:ATP-binding cassette sub-family C member 9-like n=1 Tax=Acanthaster planci TaxID=133434 RepID=A0A8B7XLA0_ACAPL|nr:ATP-binding cassette sub-family C member 9-like [Acanthaster planci]XP_022081587.1 ATP-binding cassette sub-family C member 9-like [Acanthaster planci]XP_022081588.1 ATP-binding cassette sub-family C member 9-like [Acanthaster planci]